MKNGADDQENEKAHQRYAAACAIVPVMLGVISGLIRFPEGDGFMVWLKTFGILILPLALMTYVRFALPFRVARIFGILSITILILIWAVYVLGFLSFFF